MEVIIQSYLRGLELGNASQLLTLFSQEALVYSPLYGEKKAADFYKELFNDSNESVIQWHDTFVNEQNNSASVFFTYSWTMANGKKTAFDCVDVFKFDANKKIKELRIIYDTASTRPAFEQLQEEK